MALSGAAFCSMLRSPSPMLLLIAQLLLLSLPCSSIDPSTNSDVPACRALAESLGPQVLPQCHVILPPKHFGYDTSVHVNIEVQTVYGLDEKELLEWSGWIIIDWVDPRLAWNATETGIDKMRLDRSSVWLPDVALWNAKEADSFDLRNAKFRDAFLTSSGVVQLLLYTVIQFPCEMDVRLFPFDKQSCEMEIGPVGSDSSIFNLTLETHNYDLEDLFHVGEWNLKTISHTYSLVDVRNHTLPFYMIVFHLERRVTYYTVLMIVPFELLALLASIMFFAKETGDKVNVAIAIIMSMTLYVLIASMSAPKSMNVVPLIGIFLLIQMLLLIGFTFLAILKPDQRFQLSMDETKRRLGWRMHMFILQHWDRFTFVIYISASVLNSLIFLWIWPAIARSGKAED